MTKKIILPAIIGATVIIASAFTVVSSNGYSYGTNSPYDGGDCSGCHSGGTTPTGSITASPAFGGSGTALTYVPGTTYTVTVKASTNFGFDIEMTTSNTSSAATNGGTMTAISTNCKAAGTAPKNIEHKQVIAGATGATYKWVAPAAGTVTLYAAILGVNNNGSTSGDKVKDYVYTLTPASTTGIDTHQNLAETALTVYPNPATDNLRISYTLRERGNVSIKLYNLNGELVSNLLNETQDVGIQNNDVRLPEGLAKGLYMVKLSINGQLSTQKLMVY
ncbi:MAG: choice-of-anchor V domain-containing protein [Bacteroidia bacterium]